MTGSPIAGQFLVAFNPSMANAVQERVLERVWLDALFPRILFPAEAAPEKWEANLGTNATFTRTGTMAPTTRPIPQNQDPVPGGYGIEQWEANALQYGNSIDTHMPTSSVSLASTYLRNMHVLGLNAGQSKGRMVRDRLYNAYTGGNTHVSTTTAASTSLPVRSLNGFTRKLLAGRPALISAANPLTIYVTNAGTTTAYQAIAFTMSQGDELHAGILTLASAHGGVTAGDLVLAANRSETVQSGGSTSIDGISSADKLILADCRAAIAQLRANNVPPHEDGRYHVHCGPSAELQLFDDPEFRQVYQGMGMATDSPYREFAIAELGGMLFFRNNECPTIATVSQDPTTGFTFAAPLTNTPLVGSAIEIARTIVTGQGVIEEKYLDESRYISEAGIVGKIGEFSVVNGGLQVMTERIRLILRAALDRLQQQVSASWSWSGDYPVPTDEASATSRSTLASYRRAVVLQHAA